MIKAQRFSAIPLEKSTAHIPQPLTQNSPATMVFPQPHPPPPQALSLQPYLLQEDDMTAQWPQATEYFQPIEGVNFDFDSLDALIAWEKGGVPEPTPTLPLGHNLVSICILGSKSVTYVYHRVSIGPQS